MCKNNLLPINYQSINNHSLLLYLLFVCMKAENTSTFFLTYSLKKDTLLMVAVCRSVVWRKHGRLYEETTHRPPSAMRKHSNLSTRICTRAQVLNTHTQMIISFQHGDP